MGSFVWVLCMILYIIGTKLIKQTQNGEDQCFFSKTHMQRRASQRQLDEEMYKIAEHAEKVATKGMPVGFIDCI